MISWLQCSMSEVKQKPDCRNVKSNLEHVCLGDNQKHVTKMDVTMSRHLTVLRYLKLSQNFF